LADAVSPLAATAAAAPVSDYGLASVAAQMALVLLLLLGVILLAYYLLKKFGPKIGLGFPGRTDKLTFMGHLPLGPKKSLVMVRFLNRILVLGVTEQSINYITEAKTDHEDADTDFATALEKTARSDPSF